MDRDGDHYITCPACDQQWASHDCLLGSLGNRVHYRCRGCGIDFSVLAETREQEVATDEQDQNQQDDE